MPAKPTTDQPVPGFWRRLLNVVGDLSGLASNNPALQLRGEQRAGEIAGAGMKGLAEAANNVGRTAFEGGAFLARHTGIGESLTPGYNAAYDQAGGAGQFLSGEDLSVVSPAELDQTYGTAADNPVAQFTESATQFIAGMALARGLGIENVFAQGAFSDATVFDPYQPQLAELAAKAPKWTGIGLLGQLLSVEGDHLDEHGNLVRGDGALVARIKRAAAGTIAAAVVDGLIGSARLIRSSRILASSAATPAAKAGAQAVAEDAANTVASVANGTADAGPVVVRPTNGGQYELQITPASDWLDKVYGAKAPIARQARDLANEARDLSLKATRTPEEDARLQAINEQRAQLGKQLEDVIPAPAKRAEVVRAEQRKRD